MSTAKQGEGVSLEAQKDAISGFASRNNIEIIQWFEEKETAAKSGRPIFNKMLQMLRQGKAKGMVIHKIDRSARNLKDWATISEMSDSGVDVYFATESLDFRSRGGRLTADIQAVIAADYIRNLSFEARKGIRGRLKQGIYPFPAPTGYLNTGSGNPKELDPIRAPLVRTLFDLYLTGSYSIRSLHAEIIQLGLTNQNNRHISKGNVETILKNGFYCGIMRNGRTGELFPGIHEKLITAAEFKRVKEIKEGRYTKKSTKHNHLLRRLFYCASCNDLLSPERQKGHVYYRCHSRGCSVNTVREEMLNQAVITALKKLQFSKKGIARIDGKFDGWQNGVVQQKIARSIDLRIAEAEARLQRLTDLLIDDTINKNAYNTRRESLLLDVEILKNERLELENKTGQEQDRQKFLELMKTVAGLYISSNPDEKRVLVESCFSNRIWDGQNVYLEPSNLVLDALDNSCVYDGGATRATYRTFVKIFEKQIGIETAKNESWKTNFKNFNDKKDDGRAA
ncbi:MAG: recombinase family protein [Devosiaceae bacterium]|nr:recombinase family protein [Devosiaceae bacterium]